VVGFGGSDVVLVVLVVLVVDVEVDVVVVEVVDVLAGSLEVGGVTNVFAVLVDDEDATVTGTVPPADWIFSLQAAVADSVTSTSTPVVIRLMPRSRPSVRRRAWTPLPCRAPSNPRGGR
jgi:hypothetical protein